MKSAFAPTPTPLRAAVLLLTLSLGACSMFESVTGNDRVDYGKAARKTAPLETPPDLTALSIDSRYLPQANASISANQLQRNAAKAPEQARDEVAANALADLRIERQGDLRVLVSPRSPDQVYPRVRQFWQDLGFPLTVDNPTLGVIETDWAENRAKLPQDFIRATLGKVFDNLFSTGERDRYVTHLERNAKGGTEITIAHRGLMEVYTSQSSVDTNTTWTNRPADPALETEMLRRLMISLGASATAAQAAVAQAAAPAASGTTPAATASGAKARVLTGQAGVALQVDDDAERAWRRVGLALDRTGFTVEDRDRKAMLYFVRYADPKLAGKEEPGFFSRLFSFSSKDNSAPTRFRLALSPVAGGTQVSVQNSQGAPDNSANAQRIVGLLVEDLKD